MPSQRSIYVIATLCGWKYVDGTCSYSITVNDVNYLLEESPKHSRVAITIQYNALPPDTIFYGLIRNKSDMQRIMKLCLYK